MLHTAGSSTSPAEAPVPQPGPPPTDAGPAAAVQATKPAYPAPAGTPTQAGPDGIQFDFNMGARVVLPHRESGRWRVRLSDIDTGSTLFESENTGAFVTSSKRWFVRFRVEVWALEDGKATPRSVMTHDLDLDGRDVLIHFPVGTLGDTLAWFPAAARFAAHHPRARVTCSMSPLIIPLLRDSYPEIHFVTPDEVAQGALAVRAYATYHLGLFFEDPNNDWQPTDFRQVGLHRTAGYILGVGPCEEPPRLALADEGPPIPESYVCVAVQASTQAKHWTNPDGWRTLVSAFKSAGYRVVCIDQKPVHGQGIVWNHMPHGVEDQTGDRPLAERVRWLRHARLFVGLSSGLSWLAWAAGCPTVIISGFSHPMNEFETPGRVINWHTCNSCWNDPRHQFDHGDYLWCPRHAGTARQFECTRLIAADHVIAAIRRMPGFADPAQAGMRART